MASRKFLNSQAVETDSGDVIDVVKNYSWTVSNVALAREECPRIIIKERQQTTSSIRQSMQYLAGQAAGILKGDIKDAYAGLYQVDENIKGNTYILPYYNQYHHNTANAWGENKGSIGKTVASGLGKVAAAAGVIFPSAGIEGAKSWEGSTPTEYTFTFQLLNTVSWDKAIDNKNFIQAIINNNLMDKMDFVAIRPPAICFVSIPGMRGKTVAVVSAINVANIGQMNFYDSAELKQLGRKYTGGVTNEIDGFLPDATFNLPDAYEISITIQELLTESRQIFANELDGKKVFSRVKPGPQNVQEVIEKFKSAIPGT